MSRNSTKQRITAASGLTDDARIIHITKALIDFTRECGFGDVADLAISVMNEEQNDERKVSDSAGELYFRSSRGAAEEGTEGD